MSWSLLFANSQPRQKEKKVCFEIISKRRPSWTNLVMNKLTELVQLRVDKSSCESVVHYNRNSNSNWPWMEEEHMGSHSNQSRTSWHGAPVIGDLGRWWPGVPMVINWDWHMCSGSSQKWTYENINAPKQSNCTRVHLNLAIQNSAQYKTHKLVHRKHT